MTDLQSSLTAAPAAAAGPVPTDPDQPPADTGWDQVTGVRYQRGRDVREVRARRCVVLAAGAYGICERCGRDIPAERLLARPEARTCVACAGRS